MEKEGARNQTLEPRHERRKQVVRWYKKGTKLMQALAMTGVSYPTVRAVIDWFDTGSWSAIRPAVRAAMRGRARGDGRRRHAPKTLPDRHRDQPRQGALDGH